MRRSFKKKKGGVSCGVKLLVLKICFKFVAIPVGNRQG